MICLLLNILQLHFLVIYPLQVSITDPAKRRAVNKIRSLGCRAHSTRDGRGDIVTAATTERRLWELASVMQRKYFRS